MSEKSLEMRHFQVFTYLGAPELALPGPLESLGMERTAPMEAVGYTIAGGQEAKTEILASIRARQARASGRVGAKEVP